MKTKHEAAETQPPAGSQTVEAVLIQSLAVAEHGQRWLDAAHRGNALHLLREEHARHKPARLPVWEYLAELASQAKISLDAALAAFELETQPVVGRRTAGKVAEMLSRIGCSPEEAVRMIRLSFAEVHGYRVTNELAVAFRDGSGCAERYFDEVLRRTESRYPAARKPSPSRWRRKPSPSARSRRRLWGHP